MNVTPHELPFRWHVTSATRTNITHLVELTQDGPVCSCEDFSCRVNPRRRLGVKGLACKHGRYAMNTFAEWALHTFHAEIQKVHEAHQARVEAQDPIGSKRVEDQEQTVSGEQEVEPAAAPLFKAGGGVEAEEQDLSRLYDVWNN